MKRKAFTLIELIIVMCITAILTLVIVINSNNAIKSTEKNKAKIYGSQIAMVIEGTRNVSSKSVTDIKNMLSHLDDTSLSIIKTSDYIDVKYTVDKDQFTTRVYLNRKLYQVYDSKGGII